MRVRQLATLLAWGFAFGGCSGLRSSSPPAPPDAHALAPAVAGPDACKSKVPLPGDSFYQLDVSLETSEGVHTCLGHWRGHPVIISMFYGSCVTMCPMIVEDMRATLAGLPLDVRDQARGLLVSFDPERDDPAMLRKIVDRHGLDVSRWIVARASETDVRELSAALGIAYRKMPNGEFDHGAVFAVLDTEGRQSARIEGLGVDKSDLSRAILAAMPPKQP